MAFLKNVVNSNLYSNQWFILGASIAGAIVVLMCCCAVVIFIRNRQKSMDNPETIEWASDECNKSDEISNDSIGSITQRYNTDKQRRGGVTNNSIEVLRCDSESHCMVELQIDSRGATPNEIPISRRQMCITAEDDISSDISALSGNINSSNMTVSQSPPMPNISEQKTTEPQSTFPDFDAATNTVISVNDRDVVPFLKSTPTGNHAIISTIAEEDDDSSCSPKENTMRVTLHPRREEPKRIAKHTRDLSSSVITMESSSESDSNDSQSRLKRMENAKKKRHSITALEKAKLVSRNRLHFES